MPVSDRKAPGGPGIVPRWTSSAKNGVGTALSEKSPVWFTLSHGILNEVYAPRIDQACIRDLGLIVTSGSDFFSEEKRDCVNETQWIAAGVPAFRLLNTCRQGRYRIEKEVVTDPQRATVLQQTRFIPEQDELSAYGLYVLLAPHLGNHGFGNFAWVSEYQGVPVLFARRRKNALALICSVPWLKCSVGFVGASDGWQDLRAHGQMTWGYTSAEDGNVALTAEVDLRGSGGIFVLALGLGSDPEQAAEAAMASMATDFVKVRKDYIEGWQSWQQNLKLLKGTIPGRRDLALISAAVLRTHESKTFSGGTIASLSIPWGFAKGDDDLGGYHLVWPRDMVETAGGLLALGLGRDVKRMLEYLRDRQDDDGHWEQNMWIDGSRYWGGVQLDETALPILLVDLAFCEERISPSELEQFKPMVLQAARFLVLNGPVTMEDRWEEDPGYSPFTLAVAIAALLAAAEIVEQEGESPLAGYLRETADFWNESIESWIYGGEPDICKAQGVDGYYVRVAPPEVADAASPLQGFVPIKNRPPGQSEEPAAAIISPDALALVRFGLRSPDDPRILNTIKVIDAFLKVETPNGPAWHRYNDDGYGEHEDGSPFDGTGVGRAWPLLTGERAHYEVAAGHLQEAGRLAQALENFANETGFIPEQAWDSEDLPERGLFCGKPSGSAMPLVWAHAEYLKLRRSLQQGRVFDMPRYTVARYIENRTLSPCFSWRFSHKCRTIPVGKKLRLELTAEAIVRWSANGWTSFDDAPTSDSGLGLHFVDLPTDKLPQGSRISFTFHWTRSDRWEGTNFAVMLT